MGNFYGNIKVDNGIRKICVNDEGEYIELSLANTKLVGIEYRPDVIQSIDYSVEDDTTESGFAETVVDMVTVKMQKAAENASAAVSALDTRVTNVEADVQSISNAIMGEEVEK